MQPKHTVRPSDLPDHLLAEGRHWITTDEAVDLIGRNRRVVYPRLAELERAKRLFSPAQGLYVIVPPEYRSWAVVPADWFIDPMMRHLKRSYYVAFLSAAARHGAAHQAPQTFQSIVDRQLNDRAIGRVRLHFVKSSEMDPDGRTRMNSHTGSYLVATPEMTAVDLAWRPREGGGVSNVATVLRDIGELSGERMARLATSRGRATARRLGWLLDSFRSDVDTFWLRRIAEPARPGPTALIPGNRPRGPIDRGWGVQINGTVEPD